MLIQESIFKIFHWSVVIPTENPKLEFQLCTNARAIIQNNFSSVMLGVRITSEMSWTYQWWSYNTYCYQKRLVVWWNRYECGQNEHQVHRRSQLVIWYLARCWNFKNLYSCVLCRCAFQAIQIVWRLNIMKRRYLEERNKVT